LHEFLVLRISREALWGVCGGGIAEVTVEDGKKWSILARQSPEKTVVFHGKPGAIYTR